MLNSEAVLTLNNRRQRGFYVCFIQPVYSAWNKLCDFCIFCYLRM